MRILWQVENTHVSNYKQQDVQLVIFNMHIQ